MAKAVEKNDKATPEKRRRNTRKKTAEVQPAVETPVETPAETAEQENNKTATATTDAAAPPAAPAAPATPMTAAQLKKLEEESTHAKYERIKKGNLYLTDLQKLGVSELHEIAKKLQRDPDLFLIADTQGEIIGTVLGGFDGRRGMVYHLAVADAFRGRGVGSALMDNLELQLRAKGCIRIYLLVGRDNLEAIRFYEARGWTRMDLNAFGKDL